MKKDISVYEGLVTADRGDDIRLDGDNVEWLIGNYDGQTIRLTIEVLDRKKEDEE